ncbi:MAG TPA: glucose 1-dehydrogenase [Candidatus Angelobacter sp.]|nr:glucose 1-dehydrogenase [Candidatus Angelobacter sp.]
MDAPEPSPASGEALLRANKIGICGTDLEIIQGSYGEAPASLDYLILGHECLATVAEAPSNSSGVKKGDLVAPTVRRPDGCLNCRNGESDMCLTGQYKEHGIRGLHGFCSEYSLSDVNFLVPVPAELSDVAVLLEPTSVAEKGVFQSFKLQERMVWKPERALVLGTGPVGLLTVLLLRLRGLDVTAVATRPRDSLKARIVEKIGGTYINASEQPITSLGKFDLILEETGVATLAAAAQGLLNNNGVLCLLGIYRPNLATQDIGHSYDDIVLGNKITFGSVNANRKYFVDGIQDFKKIQQRFPGVLGSMFTKMVGPSDYSQAYNPTKDDIKSVIDFQR